MPLKGEDMIRSVVSLAHSINGHFLQPPNFGALDAAVSALWGLLFPVMIPSKFRYFHQISEVLSTPFVKEQYFLEESLCLNVT
jgi:hypothetical protein